jgi:uncharacterized YccA/Bax inhibitor family protein
VRSSNPVLSRLTPETHTAPAPGYGAGYGSYPTYQEPPTYVAEQDRMTIDDVVVKTVSLLGLVLLSGVATAVLVPNELLGLAWIGGAIVGLVLGLVISFKRIISPPLMVAYAIIEGVFLGAVSEYYASVQDGIVVQAIIGTLAIFFVMLGLYKAKVIRATPKFARFMLGAVIAAVVLMLARFVMSFFGGSVLSNPGPVAIMVSLAIIAIGALTFILDFDMIEQAVAQGAPKNVAWLCAFGILVGLIWVYLEVLRLLSYLRGSE